MKLSRDFLRYAFLISAAVAFRLTQNLVIICHIFPLVRCQNLR